MRLRRPRKARLFAIAFVELSDQSKHNTLSHLSARMVNRLLRENRKSIPKILMMKNF